MNYRCNFLFLYLHISFLYLFSPNFVPILTRTTCTVPFNKPQISLKKDTYFTTADHCPSNIILIIIIIKKKMRKTNGSNRFQNKQSISFILPHLLIFISLRINRYKFNNILAMEHHDQLFDSLLRTNSSYMYPN